MHGVDRYRAFGVTITGLAPDAYFAESLDSLAQECALAQRAEAAGERERAWRRLGCQVRKSITYGSGSAAGARPSCQRFNARAIRPGCLFGSVYTMIRTPKCGSPA